jgi:DNA-directed RNA polymerase specialized sigma24 family protein
VDEREWLAERFEAHRGHLKAVAYRMLGSVTEAEDAVQDAWLRLARADTSGVENLGGWLTTIVARVCLNMLQSRKSRREEPLLPDPIISAEDGAVDPEQQALLAEGSAWRCWWCWTPWHPPSGSRSCCTTCSPCPSTRSRRS